MWPDPIIEKCAKSDFKNENVYLKKLKQTKLRRLKVKDELRSANTLPARGSLLTDNNALKELISRVQDILNCWSIFICAVHNTLLNKRKTVVSLARSRCRFNWSLSSSSRDADFHNDFALLSFVPYFFARCIFGALEILPVALEVQLTQSTTLSPRSCSMTWVSQPVLASNSMLSSETHNLHFDWPSPSELVCSNCWNCQPSPLRAMFATIQ